MCVQGASPHSQALSQAGTPHSATKPADARKTIKTMAASLFRAFDEGKLKDRGLALAQQQGGALSQLALSCCARLGFRVWHTVCSFIG